LRKANSPWRPISPSPMKGNHDNCNENYENRINFAHKLTSYFAGRWGMVNLSLYLWRNKSWKLTVNLRYFFKFRPLYPPGDVDCRLVNGLGALQPWCT
jgi:hypothetical protein